MVGDKRFLRCRQWLVKRRDWRGGERKPTAYASIADEGRHGLRHAGATRLATIRSSRCTGWIVTLRWQSLSRSLPCDRRRGAERGRDNDSWLVVIIREVARRWCCSAAAGSLSVGYAQLVVAGRRALKHVLFSFDCLGEVSSAKIQQKQRRNL